MTPDQVAQLTDAEVMAATHHGQMGRGIVGAALADRALAILAARRAKAKEIQQHPAYTGSKFGELGPAVIGEAMHQDVQQLLQQYPDITPPGSEFGHGLGKTRRPARDRAGAARSKKRKR